MKKILFLIAFSVSGVFAQNFYSAISGAQITWTNEAGTRVYQVANGDTLTTQAFDLSLYDEILFGFVPTAGDTVHFNAHFQLGSGSLPSTNGGYFANGWKAMVAKQDSAAQNGSLRGIVPTIVGIQPDVLFQTYDPSVASPADSVIFNYGLVGTNLKVGAQYARFVIVGYVGQDVTNTTLLNQCRITLRRRVQ